jgi:hypothetical protein
MLAVEAVQPLNQAVVVVQEGQAVAEQDQQVAPPHLQLVPTVLLEHQILVAEAVQVLNLKQVQLEVKVL